jgi:hypothetical protein
MHVLAIYAINEHLASLHEEARRNRLAKEAKGASGPSLLRRTVLALRAAFGTDAAGASPTAASAA